MNYTRSEFAPFGVDQAHKVADISSLQRLLITGSSGLVGGVLWHGLAGSFELYGLDLDVPEPPSNRFRADITDAGQVEAVFDRIPELAYVVHLAGDPRVDADWDSALRANIGGTNNVYAAAQRHGVKRIVYASSNHTTGAYEGFPPSLHMKEQVDHLISSRDPVRPDGFYGVSKIAGEAIARMYFELYGLQSVCLRIGTVNGRNDSRGNPREQCTWLSYRDLIHLVERSLRADVQFGIYYGVSNNRRRVWDISDAERDLGYHPQDDGSLD
jgi:nucleoside-diphosphate-sugar epimerase